MKRLLALVLTATAIYAQAPNMLWTRTFAHGNLFFGKSIFALHDSVVCFGIASEVAPSYGQKAVIYLVTTCGDSISAYEYSRVATTSGSQMIKLANGSFAITGPGEELPPISNDDFLLEKVSPLYESESIHEFDSGDIDIAYGIAEAADGGYLITGYGFLPTKSWALRLAANGDSLWSYSQDSTYLFGQSIALADNGFLVIGSGVGFASVGHLSSTGELQWDRRFDQTSIKWGTMRIDSTFLVAGSKGGYGWVASLSLAGDTSWTRTYESIDGTGVTSGALVDSGFIRLAGSSAAHPVILEIDGNGNERWSQVYSDISSTNVTSMSISEGNTALCGSQDDGGTNKLWVGYFGSRESMPFIDDFDSPELSSCWTWIREDTSHWSLTERPGWMRISTQGGDLPLHDLPNTLLRPTPETDFVVEARVSINPEQNYQGGGLILYASDEHYVRLWRGHSVTGVVNMQSHQPDGCNVESIATDSLVWLRMTLRGSQATGEYSTNGMDYLYIGQCMLPWIADSSLKVGLVALNGGYEGYDAPSISTDFDYFRIDSLPGTNVCGEVSGVWNSTGSPYYVTCDVTVPAGQTLEIQPGVEVLFTGHYKFNVFGNLQAIGTEQDSIVFTRAFPTEESRGWGLRFDLAEGTSQLSCCRIEYGKTGESGLVEEVTGGAIFIDSSIVQIDRCTFSYNSAHSKGGAIYIEGGNGSYVRNTIFDENEELTFSATDGVVTAGALQITYNSDIEISDCWFIGNTSATNGGAVGFEVVDFGCVMQNCIFENNFSSQDGGAIQMWNASPTILECNFVGNQATRHGGAISCKTSLPMITECVLDSNSAGMDGGGIRTAGGILSRCVIVNNTSGNEGGGVCMVPNNTPQLVNCTVVNNSAGVRGGGILRANSYNKNLIVWGNFAPSGAGMTPTDVGTTYSDVQGGFPDIGNIDVDPMFVDAANGNFNLRSDSPCIDTGDPASPLDSDGSRADMGAFPKVHCPPTPLPFIDNFDSPELDSCWTWIREDTSRWSLTERPGWLRFSPYYYNNNYVNWLVRTFPDSNFVIQTKLQHTPEVGTGAGPFIYLDDLNWINAELLSGQIVRTHSMLNGTWDGTNTDFPAPWASVYIQIEKIGNTYSVSISHDSVAWHHVKAWQRSLSSGGLIRVGLFTEAWASVYPVADFDYIRVDPLPGTPVCGEISGVWDSTGSPYYVNCDVTVPPGQTLVIRPGVEVLFTGHYKFNVFGNLQAIGTEEDSIIFTRAFPTEESKWGGIRIDGNSASPTQIEYCRISLSAPSGPNDYDGAGGGIRIISASPTIIHSSIENCRGGGGAIYARASSSIVQNCRFANNESIGGGQGGGIVLDDGANLTITNCLINNNYSDCRGGGIVIWNCSPQLVNCTITNNTALSCFAGGGGGIFTGSGGVAQIKNCIIWANNCPVGDQLDINSSVSFTFSDIQGGYPGIGNIDADPQFIDALNGDLHLQANSPCIDTGDPGSPLDPDGSQADMGAFPYSGPRLRVMSPNGGEIWTLLDSAVVQWVGTGFEGTVVIEINRDYPSGDWDTLAFNTPNDSVETVFVEEPISDNCRVRVSSIETGFTDVSNADFAIMPSSGYLAMVRLSQPNTALLSWNAGTMECPNAIQETFRLKNFGSASINVFRPEETPSAEFSRVTACPSSFTLLPGQVSACDLTLSFTPEGDGNYLDSMRIRTNASNGENGAVWIPLTGNQVTTPESPEVTISVQGDDALLRWPSIVASVGECPITATGYLVFYSPTQAGPFYYHGFTTDTSYTHTRVVHYNYGMFYHVYATIEPLMMLSELPDSKANRLITEDEVLGLMRQRCVVFKQIGQ